MFSVKKILHEIHERSVWQVLSVYVAGSWGVLQAVEMVIETTALPDWVLPFTIVLLLIGLPLVTATAVIQGGISLGRGTTSAASVDPSSDAPHGSRLRVPPGTASEAAAREGRPPAQPAASAPERARRLFTWRNVVYGGGLAAAVWALIAVGWFARDFIARASADPLDVSPVASIPALDGTAAGEPDAGLQATFPADTSAGAPAEALGEDDARAADDDANTAQASGAELGDRDEGETPDDAVRRTARRPTAADAAPPRRDPAPPRRDPAPPDEAEDVEAFTAARGRAEAARTAALSVLPQGDRSPGFAPAESLRRLADAAAAEGRYTDGAAMMREAESRYRLAHADAITEWVSILGDLRADLERPRAAADAEAGAVREAAELERTAAGLEAGGDPAGAGAALRRALELYRSAPAPAAAEREPAAGRDPRDVVDRTLARLAGALSDEDLGAVRRIWVSLSQSQADNFETFFGLWSDIDVAFEPNWGSMRDDGEEIRITVETTWRFVEDGRDRAQDPFIQTFVLAERGGEWVILGN